LVLLALGLAALWCATTAPTRTIPRDDTIRMSAAGSCLLANESHRSSHSDQQWRPQQQAIAAVSESIWKSAPVQSALAAPRSARTLDTARASRSHDPPVRFTPPFLLNTPLLI
jgi:hypothetical protein